MGTFRKAPKLMIAALLLLMLLRAILPYFLEKYVNHVLNRLPDYKGHVSSIDVALYRGAYTIHNLTLTKRSGRITQPYIHIPTTDLSIQWMAIFKGKFVGEIAFDKPQLNLVNDVLEKDTQITTDGDWQAIVRELFPVKINQVAISDGKLTYRHSGDQSDQALVVSALYASIKGLTNRPGYSNDLSAKALIQGLVQNVANLQIEAKIDPLAARPTFDAELKSDKIPLTSLNKLLNESIYIDAEDGTLQLFAEVSSKNAYYKGYLKPVLRNVKIVSLRNDSDNILRLSWEGIVGLITEVFTNLRHSQFASKIPFEGRLDKGEADIWHAIKTIFQNAYIEALKARIDGDVAFSSEAD